jgi:hypothetical protein
MKKKYSTDDLVRWVEGIAPGFHECCPPFAIIARLKNADELAEVATIIADKCLGEYPVSQRMLRKAIADYNINKGE